MQKPANTCSGRLRTLAQSLYYIKIEVCCGKSSPIEKEYLIYLAALVVTCITSVKNETMTIGKVGIALGIIGVIAVAIKAISSKNLGISDKIASILIKSMMLGVIVGLVFIPVFR